MIDESKLELAVLEQTSQLAEGCNQVAEGFKRKADSMQKLKSILESPRDHSVYDLVQASIEGGYRLKLNFQDIGVEG